MQLDLDGTHLRKYRMYRRSLGCLDPQCVLCEHNPHRRCNVNFAPKYLVNDVLKAKCDAPIRVEIIDRQTGVPLGEDIADVHLEVRQPVHLAGHAASVKAAALTALNTLLL